jgi:hypothetical protein
MPLQTSGPISLGNIQAQFGGVTPAGLGEYYSGGIYVDSGTQGTNGTITWNIPSSGTIKVSDFYGAPKGVYKFSIIVGFTGTAGVSEESGYRSGVMGSITGDYVTPTSTVTGVWSSLGATMSGTVEFTYISFTAVTTFTSLKMTPPSGAVTYTVGTLGGVWLGTTYRWAGDTLNGLAIGTVIPCVLTI